MREAAGLRPLRRKVGGLGGLFVFSEGAAELRIVLANWQLGVIQLVLGIEIMT